MEILILLFLMAVVVPEMIFLKDWADERKIPFDIATLVENKDLKRDIMRDFEHLQKENELQGFEGIKDILINKFDFTPDNDLTTPTMKLKRQQLKKHFENELTSLYKENGVEIPKEK